jgi:trimethylamine:corrinoid methyltransferase-like protein
MVDRTNWDQWAEQGSRDWRARANEIIDENLATYEVEPLPEKLHGEIRDLLLRTGNDKDVTLPAFTETVNA